jgi:hypothetical protein
VAAFLRDLSPRCKFAPPAPEREIELAVRELGALPASLCEFLRETNGAHGADGSGLVWPVEQIRADNKRFRAHPDFPELYMPFDCLLFFADAGNGDQFAFRALGGQIDENVCAWNHENDNRVWVASSFRQYLEWLLTGRIEL